MFSVNNKLILEVYVKEGLKAKISGGIATPGQRDGVKGLKLLVDASTATHGNIPAGSLAYIKEEVLHNHSQTIFKHLTCDAIPDKFMSVDLQYVEFFEHALRET